MKKEIEKFIATIKFNEQGLIPAIAQDYKTNQVLMLAYMNEDSIRETFLTKKVHYFSRSRNKLWMKGETSNHIQHLKELYIDCDNDTILLKVEQVGNACHTGEMSCFFTNVSNFE
jgi:phosphoribosyl-ATP pyrophosphohydrolase/phosphoribosyl-AMP cyclohydrolase